MTEAQVGWGARDRAALRWLEVSNDHPSAQDFCAIELALAPALVHNWSLSEGGDSSDTTPTWPWSTGYRAAQLISPYGLAFLA